MQSRHWPSLQRSAATDLNLRAMIEENWGLEMRDGVTTPKQFRSMRAMRRVSRSAVQPSESEGGEDQQGPGLPHAVGLRPQRLTNEEAAELERMIDNRAAPPSSPPRRVPVAASSVKIRPVRQ